MEIYFEDIHKSTQDYPYIDAHMENINYIAHYHEELEVIYVLSGTVNISTETHEFNIHKGDICLFMPGEIHGFTSFENNRLYIIKLPSQTSLNLINIRLRNNVITKNDSIYAELKIAIVNLIQEDKFKKNGYKLAVPMYCYNLFTLIVRNIPYLNINPEEKNQLTKKWQLINSVNHYINQNYQNVITLNDAANYCKYSKYYFAHLFKESTRKTFTEYLTLYRLEKAASMIKSTDDNISHIAFLCGFNSIKNFNRTFKQQFKTTPTQYRCNIDKSK